MSHYTARQVKAAEQRVEDRRALTLARLPEWGEAGMPPLCWVAGSPLATLRGLEDDGLARRLPEPDRLGTPRFVITPAGLAKLAEFGG